jgi:hypothetical protein
MRTQRKKDRQGGKGRGMDPERSEGKGGNDRRRNWEGRETKNQPGQGDFEPKSAALLGGIFWLNFL